MKIRYLFPILVLLLVLTACQPRQKQVEYGEVTYIVEDVTDKTWEDGNYYRYNFNDFNTTLVIIDLMKQNIDMRDAWVKEKASKCCPPTEELCIERAVEGEFILKISKETITPINFTATKPEFGFCAYEVKHYVFVKK